MILALVIEDIKLEPTQTGAAVRTLLHTSSSLRRSVIKVMPRTRIYELPCEFHPLATQSFAAPWLLLGFMFQAADYYLLRDLTIKRDDILPPSAYQSQDELVPLGGSCSTWVSCEVVVYEDEIPPIRDGGNAIPAKLTASSVDDARRRWYRRRRLHCTKVAFRVPRTASLCQRLSARAWRPLNCWRKDHGHPHSPRRRGHLAC